jgi:hypothetical protein
VKFKPNIPPEVVRSMCTTALRLSGVDQLITGSLITTDMLRLGNMNALKLKLTIKLMLGLDARL